MTDIEIALKTIKYVESWSLNSYAFDIEQKKNTISSDFTIHIKPSENPTNPQRKRIITNFCEYKFQIDKNRKLTSKD